MKKEKMNKEIILIRLYIIIIILEAPIRYMLNLYKYNNLIYIKDLIMLILLVLGLWKNKFNNGHIWIFIGASISCVVATIYVKNIKQIGFFILKIFVPFMVGILQYKNILNDFKQNKLFYEVCFWISVVGVILNSFIEYPWEGLAYDVGEYDVSASWSWTTTGQKRIAGFTRTSINAAIVISIFLILIQLNEKNSKIKKIICCIIALYAIWITTMKGTLIAIILFYFINIFNINFNKKMLINVLIIIMILLPIFSMICEPMFEYLEYHLDYKTYRRYFYSFRERLQGTWPDAFKLVESNGNIFLGRGFGGVGASQSYYEPDIRSPADNLFVYLYITCGVFSFILLYYIMKKVNEMDFKESDDIYVYNILVLICAYGIVSNIVEGALLGMLFGCCVGYMLKKK